MFACLYCVFVAHCPRVCCCCWVLMSCANCAQVNTQQLLRNVSEKQVFLWMEWDDLWYCNNETKAMSPSHSYSTLVIMVIYLLACQCEGAGLSIHECYYWRGTVSDSYVYTICFSSDKSSLCQHPDLVCLVWPGNEDGDDSNSIPGYENMTGTHFEGRHQTGKGVDSDNILSPLYSCISCIYQWAYHMYWVLPPRGPTWQW